MSRAAATTALTLAVVLGASGVFVGTARVVPRERYARIAILHTNDIHGQALPLGRGAQARGGLAALASTIARERALAWEEGWEPILVDAGDLWVGPPEGTRTEGAFVISVLNTFDYALGAIGNHEFDHGPPVAERNARNCLFPILAANVREAGSDRRPPWLTASVHRSVGGVDVRFVGLVTSDIRRVTVASATAGLDFEKEEAAVERELARDEGAALTVLVTHCGDDVDRRLAERFRGRIAAIVGGHSHRAIDPAWHVPEGASDAVLVGQAGAKTTWLGSMRLLYDRVVRRVVRSEGHLVAVAPSNGEDDRVREAVAKESAEVEKLLGARVCELTAPLEVKRGVRSSPLGNLFCDAMREGTGVDVAFQNKPGLRANLASGTVLLRHLFEVDPFGNTVVTMTLSGSELEKLLDMMCESPTGVLELSGAVVHLDPGAPRGRRVSSVVVGGRPLDPKRNYTIATNSFLAGGGDGHEGFREGHDRRDEGVLVRDLVRQRLERASRFDPGPLDERLIAPHPDAERAGH